MKLKTLGNGLLMVAFLFSAAAIAEPSAATSAVVALLLFAGFAVVTWQSHNDWAAGYSAAQLELAFTQGAEETFDPRPVEVFPYSLPNPKLLKCGMNGCECEDDPNYREWPDD